MTQPVSPFSLSKFAILKTTEMQENFQMTATTLFGLEEVLAKETYGSRCSGSETR